MHPVYANRNRIDRAPTAAMSAAASGTKGDQSAAIGNWTAERCAAATSTQCVSVPFTAANIGGAVLAAGRPGRLPRPENDLVRGAVPLVESEEHRLGDELGTVAQHLPEELDRQQVLHVHGGVVIAAGLFLRGHHLAAVEPCGETQAVGAASGRRHELREVLETGSR